MPQRTDIERQLGQTWPQKPTPWHETKCPDAGSSDQSAGHGGDDGTQGLGCSGGEQGFLLGLKPWWRDERVAPTGESPVRG